MRWNWAFLLAALTMLAGCSQLPIDGPAKQDIASGASAVLSSPPNAVVYDYALVDINPIVLDCLAVAESGAFFKTFGGLARSGGAPAIRVGAGDVLQIAVFESPQGSLFQRGANSTNNGGGSFVSFPVQMVSSAGSISVPYAGPVHVAGRTVPEIEREIQTKLEKSALEPQVVVTLTEQNSSTVTVIGDAVTASSKLKLTGSGERILDMISKVGGLRYPGYEVYITLRRENRSATLYFPELIKNPNENIFLHPGDMIYAYRYQRRFVGLGALGASSGGASTGIGNSLVGAVGLFAFDQDNLSLNEAIGKAGGLQDDRADPAQVFIYRMERRQTLERMGVDLTRFAENQEAIPTIYRANFRDPSVFLFAQRFPIRNIDTIYVGNADANEFLKLTGYVTAVTGSMNSVATDAATVIHHGP